MEPDQGTWRQGGVFSVTLPRQPQPIFPKACVVCCREDPAASTVLVSRDGLKGAAVWAGWFTVRVPCCPSCGRRLQIWRIWNVARTLLIAGGSFAFGIFVLLPRLEGWQCGLSVLAMTVAGLGAVFVWNRLLPPAFSVDPHDSYVEFEFRDRRLAEAFSRLNEAQLRNAMHSY